MPSRRKSAHTTKIERVPRFEVYHGESDVDERCGEDGTLDLSMKRIKVEPVDYSETGDASEIGAQSKKFKQVESHPTPVETKAETAQSSGDDITQRGEVNESNEPTQGKPAESTAAETRESGPGANVADDANANTSGDHVTSQVALGSPIVYTTSNGQLFTESTAQKSSAVTGQQLFPQTSKGRSMRPFKLYTSNRDLLAGLSTQGAPTLAAYSVPIALAAAPGAVPLAFASMPVVTGAPMIPVTTSAASTTATTSAAAMGAGKDAAGSTSTSAATTNSTAKSTSATTDVHLMTLATEADKILRERHASGESLEKNSDMGDSAMEGDTAEDLSAMSSNGDVTEGAVNEEGTVLKIPSLSSKANSNGADETLTLIHKRAVAAAVAASSPHKSKKKRQTLPEDLKDNAYWERRRKNNEAAKRSRDARRAKEDQIAIRAALLEQENIRLKIEVASLKEETAKLRSMLYSNNNS